MVSDVQTQKQIKLPERLVGSVDISRIIRELKNLDDWLNQAALRRPGESMQLPKTSQSLEDLSTANAVNLLEPKQRTELIEMLVAFSVHAPRIHMSFATEPTAHFTTEVVAWLRRTLSPLMLLEIGLQPNLAAGCIVRTDNKLFDMSLRHRFKENRHLLVEKIAELPAEPVIEVSQPQPPQPSATTAAVPKPPTPAVTPPAVTEVTPVPPPPVSPTKEEAAS